jgi:hypothetical protein
MKHINANVPRDCGIRYGAFKHFDDPKPKRDFGYFAQRASRQLRHVESLIVAGVKVGPIRGTERNPLRSIDRFINRDSYPPWRSPIRAPF